MKHYIIVKYKDAIQETRKAQALFPEIEKLFQQAAAALPGIASVTVKAACRTSEIRYDLMICMNMEKDALAVFDASEYHRKWKERFAPFIAHKVIFDCE